MLDTGILAFKDEWVKNCIILSGQGQILLTKVQ
jgi:hypothetical protein